MVKTYKNWIFEEESGQGMVEYALIIAFIALALVGALTTLRTKMVDFFNNVATAVGA